MRTLIVIAGMLLLPPLVSNGQTNSGVVTGSDGQTVAVVDNIHAAVIPTIKPNNIEGSPYLGDDWGKGSVYFKKGKIVDSLTLRFNIKDNQLLFRQDGQTLYFMDEVLSFTYTYPEGGDIQEVYFKSGYPGKSREGEKIFYKVLAGGEQYELLQLPGIMIQEEYVYNGLNKRKYKPTTEWYVYAVAKKELIKVKPDKEVLEKKLPAAAARITQLCKEKKWDLKTEEGMVQLFEALNVGK
jgi:hypothetical protein